MKEDVKPEAMTYGYCPYCGEPMIPTPCGERCPKCGFKTCGE